MSRLVKTGILCCSLAVAALGAGCSGSTAEGSTVAQGAAATKAPIITATHGRAKIAALALGDVPLRSDQRAQIEKLAASADAEHASVRAARQALLLALADQIARGQVDPTALAPNVDAVSASASGVTSAERAGLEELHAILDAKQRTLFADALHAEMQARRQSRQEHGAGGGWTARWADLHLTPDQEAQIERIVQSELSAEHGQWKGRFQRDRKMFEAFKGEAFVLDQVAPPVDVKAMTADRTGRFVEIAREVLPLLTPEQRAIAAEKLRERAAAVAPEEETPADPLL